MTLQEFLNLIRGCSRACDMIDLVATKVEFDGSEDLIDIKGMLFQLYAEQAGLA